jgi:hypothetical protein
MTFAFPDLIFFLLLTGIKSGILQPAYLPSLCENMLNSGGFSFWGGGENEIL